MDFISKEHCAMQDLLEGIQMLSVPTVEYSVLIRLLFVAEVVLWADKEL
jgi:hypothetical protein